MNLLMISGDRSMLEGKQGAFWYTLEALSKEWDRIDIICPKAAGLELRATGNTLDSRLSTQTFFGNVHFHPSPKGLWYQSFWIKKRGKQLAELFSHHVMTVHEYPPFYNGIGGWMLSRATGIPYVLEIHHLVGYPVAADWQERIGRVMSWLYIPWAIARSQCARLVSKNTAERLMKWGAPQGKIRVVPSFYLDRQLIESLGEAPPVQYDVVFCGRLVSNKGLKRVIEALAHIPRGTLLVIGDGPERKPMQDLAKALGIEHRVEFRGWLPSQRDVLRALRSAKVFVMNSSSEGGPRVALEAMAIGMPVLVTNVGVMPDVIINHKNGVLTTGESKDVAEKLQQMIGDPAWRAEMGNMATKVLDRFERAKLIAQYARFLQSFARRDV